MIIILKGPWHIALVKKQQLTTVVPVKPLYIPS